MESSQAVRTGGRIGWILPAHNTAAGRVLPAELSTQELAELSPPDRRPLRAPALREPRAQLAEARERGYAAVNTPGDASEIAALVRGRRGRPRAAPIVTAPQSRVRSGLDRRHRRHGRTYGQGS
ncbi:IclR family transcriptional regulator domain-containing protein [Streptomyces sp. NBC_00582]|uniref:IclR family transcriptional regulator domain-containing protein n=1 Tax=Streptomyces sp. NBC_00582 TaxID=2975783 RepID=UPI003FCCA86F